MKSAAMFFVVLVVAQVSIASTRCFTAATQIAQNFVVAETALKEVKSEPSNDRNYLKYTAVLQNTRNPSQKGAVVIVLSARDCSEVMSMPSF